MNTTSINALLKQWTSITEAGECTSKRKAEKSPGGLSGRIKRTTGQPVVFDFETYNSQKEIQNSLCKKIPQWGDLIRSKPEIMDGHPWTRGDFIELYYGHFRMVIEKLTRIINQQNFV